ncbi:hypothetical protein [Thermoflavimicrobium daqui]|jgi:flagellar biosynthesis GTPase FlhF|uniref:sunset domain-containing protein n=1 Tax=Thermoflavimicrobium daqui TaxID=2137476 RepID=UPI00143E055B|nr:hypothetical protein [Thermoflavimicrobium daqui]
MGKKAKKVDAMVSLPMTTRAHSEAGRAVEVKGYLTKIIEINISDIGDGVHTFEVQESKDGQEWISVPPDKLDGPLPVIYPGHHESKTIHVKYKGSKAYIRVVVYIDQAHYGSVYEAKVLLEKKVGAGLGCLMIAGIILLLGSCVAVFGDTDTKKSQDPPKQTVQQNDDQKEEKNKEDEKKKQAEEKERKEEEQKKKETEDKKSENSSDHKKPSSTKPQNNTQSSDSDNKQSSGCRIKGNIGSNGKIYHVPGGKYYARTKAEECFDTEAEARAAGFRPSKR